MARAHLSRRLLRFTALALSSVLVAPLLQLSAAPSARADGTNEIVTENAKTGNLPSEWDVEGAGDATIQGYATQMSVNHGEKIEFKIDLDDPNAGTTADYLIKIYRLGYYDGRGAREVATISADNTIAKNQPACDFDAGNGNLVDCGNWSVSAEWTVPADAVSGIYIARPTRLDTGGASHIAFVVRDDDGGSDILVQTSDTTWQAYNAYGGYNLYGTFGATVAQKVSYNRPFATRGGELENWLFNAEYPMLRWLERNGYDVSYTTHVDTGVRPAELLEHKTFMSSGHDEYWSQAQRDSVEAARAGKVNLAFFSGNEIYWRVRWENSANDGVDGDQRTMVVYKQGSLAPSGELEHRKCYLRFDCDPTGEWTGLWRESTEDGESVIGSPENAVTGQISWRDNTSEITVPSDYADLRFWRNTAVADLTGDQTVTLGDGTLGYEWSPQYEQYAHWYPAGRVLLSATDATSSFAGTERHHLSLYRATSGALVFGAGTVQWAWGLDSHHDRTNTQTSSAEDPDLQQATLNLLADMGAQAATRQAGLAAASASTDTSAPSVQVTAPTAGGTLPGGAVTVTGTATDAGGGVVGVVEVSTDDGYTWHAAEGREDWTYTYVASTGENKLRVRAADDSANLGSEVVVTFVAEPRTCAQAAPCSIFPDATTGIQDVDSTGTEVGMKFQSSVDGYVTGVRFYKTADNSGTHTGSLWTSTGTRLASVQFSGESGSGWQNATFAAPVAIAADTTYVISYHAPDGHVATGTAFTLAGVDNPPLRALQDGEAGSNGVYKNSSTPVFPTTGYHGANYLVDVRFATEVGPDVFPPTVLATTPSTNATRVPVTAKPTVTFSEPMLTTSLSPTTIVVRDQQNNAVATSVAYAPATRTVTIEPESALAYNTKYTVTVTGGTSGVKDTSQNALGSSYSWAFTTAAAPATRTDPNQGPGGPVLVVKGSGTYDSYLLEILRGEGLNLFTVGNVDDLTSTGLAAYTTVVLGRSTLNTAAVTALTEWVERGGNLVAMRPDAQLAGLLGLSAPSGTLSEGYLKVDDSTAPGAGVTSATMQFHGTADRYTVQSGTQVVATLYSDAGSATSNPAVTLRSVGEQGGSAAAFTYDLATSVVLTRQGNPDWVNQNRDGQAGPNRSDDLFYGAMAGDVQADYVDRGKVDIPQADEQQRLLANVLTTTASDATPLPRFWYLPRGEKAAIVMTADNHDDGNGNGTVSARFEHEETASPSGCSVEDWECIRSTAYIYPDNVHLTTAAAQAFQESGFEIALHPYTACVSPTREEFADLLATQLDALANRYEGIDASTTSRNHCIAWSDYTVVPEELAKVGIHLDTNYYYWPASWVKDKPGVFTGSGFAQRFSSVDGDLIDVYQATTQMTDEAEQSYPETAIALMDAAIDKGYYGTFVANIHADGESEEDAAAIVAAAKDRKVPVISAQQLLTWTDGRNNSSFENISMTDNRLTFGISAASGSRGLEAMLPVQGPQGVLQSLTLGGTAVSKKVRTVAGVTYWAFTAGIGTYTATYGEDVTPPEISSVKATATGDGQVRITWTTDEAATSRVSYGPAADQLTSAVEDTALVTAHELVVPGVGRTIHYRVSSTDAGGHAALWPAAADDPATFTLPSPVATDDTTTDFRAGTTGNTYVSDTAGGELILRPQAVAEFDGTTLPADWTSTQWADGSGAATVSGGRVSLDGTRLRSNASGGAGRSLEFTATFGSAAHQHAGFGVDLDDTARWAIFSTGDDGTELSARVNNNGTAANLGLGSRYLGASHRYRIDWLADSIVFSIDGVVAHTEPVALTGEMTALASDYTAGGGVLAVNWMRMSPYASVGTFLSRVHDAGGRATWGTLSWNADTPAGTTVQLSVRTGNTADPDDGTWSDFATITNGAEVAATARYVQYRVAAETSNDTVTPELASVTIEYTLVNDTTAPEVTGRAPAPNASGVAVGVQPTITFSEAVDPATVTVDSVRLRANGTDTDVATTLAVNGATVTIQPAAPLAPATAHTLTVTTAVRDLSGNALAQGQTWTFTTETLFLSSTPVPTITGTVALGQTLIAVPGDWKPAPVDLAYQWYRDNDPISGADTATHTLTVADVGTKISVQVTGTKTGYVTATTTSPQTITVPAGTLTTPVPTITGTVALGQTLIAVPGDWKPAPVDLAYQWYRDNDPISGADTATHTLTVADVGTKISVQVTGTKTGYVTATTTSPQTITVPAGTLTAPEPTITGTVALGQTLIAVPGDWKPAPVDLAYQWYRDNDPISGADTATHTLTVADVGTKISVQITGTKTGYATITKASDQTAAVAAGTLTATPTPTITGTVALGQTLTAVPGDWAPTPLTLTYQWYRGDDPIEHADATTYTLTVADVDTKISVRVTGTKTGYATITKASDQTAAVAAGTLTATPTPTITGTVALGQTLTAVPGDWAPTPLTLTYQWYRGDDPISGADTATYTLTVADVGTKITVRVTGTKTGYATITKASDQTAAVAAGALTATPTPTITGTVALGQTLTAVPGDWAPTPVDLAYQWYRDTSPISGATKTTYTLTVADVGTRITVRITGTKTGYVTATTTSPQTITVPAGTLTTPTPTITGTAALGQTLTAVPGTWAPTPLTLTYQWYRGTSPISGATKTTYTLTVADVGTKISVQVTGTKTGYAPTSKTSAQTAAIAAGTLAATPTPKITGTVAVGQTLTAVPGDWTPAPVTLAYQWYRGTSPISGATKTTYTLAVADVGTKISVRVTGTKTGYATITKASDQTAAVSAGQLTTTPTPTLSGTAAIGQTLTVVPGDWAPGPVTLAYQWLRNDQPITGETGATYTVRGADVGFSLKARVTGTRTGYAPVVRTSAATAVIAAGAYTSAPVPTISGTLAVDQVLTAVPGDWRPGDLTFTYQWYRQSSSGKTSAISGATAGTYTPGAADLGYRLQVTVTGSLVGYPAVPRTSSWTSAVAKATFASTLVPAVRGVPRVSAALTTDTSMWSPTPTLKYQWYRLSSSGKRTAIKKATAPTYQPSSSMKGRRLQVRVIASRPGYVTATRYSQPTEKVLPGMVGRVPKVSDRTPTVDQLLTAVEGTWSPAATTFTYQWYAKSRSGKVYTIAGATGKTYQVDGRYAGYRLKVKVIGSATGYAPVSKTSAYTSKVGTASFSTRPIPTVSGTAQVGQRLTAVPGGWSPTPTSYSYQWYRSGSAIKGATQATYLVASADAGKTLRVKVTARRAGYASVSKTSQSTGAVAP